VGEKTAEANAKLMESYDIPGVKNDWQPHDNRPTSDILRGASTAPVTGQAVEHLIRQEQRYLPYNNNRTQLVMEAIENTVSEFENLQYTLSKPKNTEATNNNLKKIKTRCAESRTLFFPNHLTQTNNYAKTICKDLLPFAITTEADISAGDEYDTQFTSNTQEKITLLRMKNKGSGLPAGPDTSNTRNSYIAGRPVRKLLSAESGGSIATINNFSRKEEFGLQTEPTGLAKEVIDQKLWSPEFNPIATTEDKKIYFNAAFGYYRDKPKFSKPRFHKGIDVVRRAGLPIVAVADGIIKKVRHPVKTNSEILCIVEIDHSKKLGIEAASAISQAFGDGDPISDKTFLRQNEEKIYKITTTYMHMFELGEKIKKDHYIQAGEIIGYTGGKTGWPGAGGTTGPHLHFEVAITAKNKNPPAGKPAEFLGETTLEDAGHQKSGIPQVDPTFFKYPQLVIITKEQKEQYTKRVPTTSPKT